MPNEAGFEIPSVVNEPSTRCETERRDPTEMSGALAVQTSPVQFGAGSLTSKPPVTASAAKGKGKDPELADVEIRFTIKERLERLEFASKLSLKADNSADFTEEEIRKLRQLTAEYTLRRQTWFRGKRSPTIGFQLVALRRSPPEGGSDDVDSAGPSAGTGIVIKGLPSESDIREFHKVMSKTIIRDLYSPLRLCYDTALIQRPSTFVVEHYVYGRPEPFETLCGTHIITRRRQDDTQWASTLGGLIEVDGSLFAITTSHTPVDDSKSHSLTPSDADLSSSMSSTIAEADYGHDVNSALILDEPAVDAPLYFPRRWSSTEHRMYKLSTRHLTSEEGG